MLSYLYKYRIQIIITVASLLLYAFYIYDLRGNPPGFYIDESLLSYNAYVLSQTGHGEFGQSFPLYFPVIQLPPPNYFLGYADPAQIYLLAGLFLIFSPSVLLPRLVCATATYIASLLLGRLSFKISGHLSIGIITALAAILTPWLFETGRLAFATGLYPLAIALFLLAVYRAHKAHWSLINCLAIGVTLALLTYTYSIGRLLGPLLALGLIIFATNLRRFAGVIQAWCIFGILLIPMLIFHLRNPDALAGRFNMTVGIMTPAKTNWEVVTQLLTNFAANISVTRMLFVGDTNLRHHINDTGPVLAVVLILAVFGLILIVVKHRKDSWWWFVLYGLTASVVPASLTHDQFHMLRLIGFPVFMIVMAIPALMWLIGERSSQPEVVAATESEIADDEELSPNIRLRKPSAARKIRYAVCSILLIAGLAQAVLFQMSFWTIGPKRGLWFDDSYSRVLDAALTKPGRPIYLKDGYWGQGYLHGYWWALVKGVDLSTFVHLREGEPPPNGVLVLSAEQKCDNCEMLYKEDTYFLYRQVDPPPVEVRANP